MFTFNHFNFNVKNLEESLRFYKDALGLEPVSTKESDNFILVFLGDGKTGFRLELTYMKDRTESYDLGEQEYHLAMTADDYDSAHALHEKMGCICFENPSMGIYFLEDPDGYWIEIVRDGSYMEAHTK
ncbi:MAG: VOC family protein [Lachnospiraceae bacterium]|nr:VOC family protein [Lachnospiraceae bacterium]